MSERPNLIPYSATLFFQFKNLCLKSNYLLFLLFNRHRQRNFLLIEITLLSPIKFFHGLFSARRYKKRDLVVGDVSNGMWVYLTSATICLTSVPFCGVYLRLRRNIKLSFWQIYSKPNSSNALTPSSFLATFTRALIQVKMAILIR